MLFGVALHNFAQEQNWKKTARVPSVVLGHAEFLDNLDPTATPPTLRKKRRAVLSWSAGTFYRTIDEPLSLGEIKQTHRQGVLQKPFTSEAP